MAWIRERSTRRGIAYYIQWRDDAGRVRSERVGHDPVLAEARRRAVESADGIGVSGPPSPAAALERFLESLRLAQRRQGTLDFYAKHLRPLFATLRARPLADWTRRDLERYLSGRSWSPRRVHMVAASCRRFLGWARRSGLSCQDWLAGVELPTCRTTERVIPNPAEVRALLVAARGRTIEAAVALAACAGLSLGDLRAITWGDVDLDGGWIRTTRAKTGEPIRVPIVPTLAEVLLRHRAAVGPVCRGLPATDPHLHEALRRIYRAAGVQPAGFHGLRHAWASIMQREGVPVAAIGRLLAHRPGSVVTLRYLHVDDADLVAAAAAVERSLG